MYLRFAIRTWDSIDSMLALISRVINPLDDWCPIIDSINSDYWQLDREERLFAKFDDDCVWITVATGVDADQLRRLELALISAISIPERVNLSQRDTNTLNRPSFQLPCWTTDTNQIIKLVGSVIQASISELRPNNHFFAPILDAKSKSYQLDRVGIWRLFIDDGIVKTLEISGYHASDSVLAQMRNDLITAVNAHANMFFDPATNVWAPKAKPEFDPMDSRKTLTRFIQQSKIEMDIMLKNDPELWWAELDKLRTKQRELLTLSPVYDPLGDGLSALQLIDVMGLDLSVVNDARSSFKKVSAEFDSKDRKLLSYLAHANPPHFSPFRGCVLKFRVSAPLSICRQWWKHAVASSHVDDQLQHNEQSFRYTEVTQPDFYTPTQYYNQSANNRQASDGALHPDDNQKAIELVEEQQRLAFETYRALLDLGVSREDARNSLPVGTYTTWTWTVSLQALINFIELRKGNGAQHQIVAYAQVLDEIVTRLFPEVAYACLRDLPEVD